MLKLEPVTYQSLPLAIDEDLEFRWQYTSQQRGNDAAGKVTARVRFKIILR